MDLAFIKKVAAVSLFTVVAGLQGHVSSFSTASAAAPEAALARVQALGHEGAAWNRFGRREGIEGVWLSQVTITDCHGTTQRAFTALNMFQAGGTLTDTDNQPPASHGPAFGTWWSRGGGNFGSVFQFFRFNADGTFAGSNYVTREISLDADDDAFTSTITVAVLSPAGVQVGTACGSETAERLK
jgi:hypothetical protein